MPSSLEAIPGQPARRPELFPYVRDYLIRRGLIRPAQPPRPAVQQRAECLETGRFGGEAENRSTPGVFHLIELRQAQGQRQPAANVTVRIGEGYSRLMRCKSHRSSRAPLWGVIKGAPGATARVVPHRGPWTAAPRCAGHGCPSVTGRSLDALQGPCRTFGGSPKVVPTGKKGGKEASRATRVPLALLPLAAPRSPGGYRPQPGARSARPRLIQSQQGVAS